MKQLKKNYKSHCSKLGVKAELRTTRSDSGAPHVEKIEDAFHWIVTERGSEFQRKTTTSRHEIEYWLISGVVSALSIRYEVKNRIKGQDFRRLMFKKRIELMNLISTEWAIKLENEIKNILKEHPYKDGN